MYAIFILCRSASITDKCIIWIHVHFNTSSHVRRQREPIKVAIDFCIYSLKQNVFHICMYVQLEVNSACNLHAVSQCLNRECNSHYTQINTELRASMSIRAL